MSKKKILLLFPDGVGVRNYLYTDVFKTLEEELVLFHNFDEQSEAAIKNITNLETTVKIPVYSESLKEKFFRELISLSRLNNNAKVADNNTILTNWKSSHQSISKKIFYKTIEFVTSFIKSYKTILVLEKQYQNVIRRNPFYNQIKKILEEISPEKIFCSHQRGLQCATIFAVAQDLGIKSTTVIYSWDNLPKARMALRADNYLVWSEYMKNEMEIYYPEIDLSKVHITGTPQFECYENSDNIINKEVFYETYNLDKDKKLICFSGDDVLTSPDDPKYLEDVATELIKAGLDNQYQILLRRCPVDVSGRFDEVVRKYQELIKESPPLWNFNQNKNWETIYPLVEDVKLLVSTAYYADVVINVGSTMAFDFAMFKKPCIFINYDQEKKNVQDWSVNIIYEFQHFKSMPNKNAVIWLNNKNEIIETIRVSLDGDNYAAMKLWSEVVLGDYKNASSSIKNMVIS